MKHTLQEIEKMLNEANVWPLMSINQGAKDINCGDLISDLVEEVKKARDLSIYNFELMKETEKENKRLREALEASGDWKNYMEKQMSILIEALSFYANLPYSKADSRIESYDVSEAALIQSDNYGDIARKALEGK